MGTIEKLIKKFCNIKTTIDYSEDYWIPVYNREHLARHKRELREAKLKRVFKK